MDLLNQRVDGVAIDDNNSHSLEIDVELDLEHPKNNVYNFNQLVREETGATAEALQAINDDTDAPRFDLAALQERWCGPGATSYHKDYVEDEDDDFIDDDDLDEQHVKAFTSIHGQFFCFKGSLATVDFVEGTPVMNDDFNLMEDQPKRTTSKSTKDGEKTSKSDKGDKDDRKPDQPDPADKSKAKRPADGDKAKADKSDNKSGPADKPSNGAKKPKLDSSSSNKPDKSDKSSKVDAKKERRESHIPTMDFADAWTTLPDDVKALVSEFHTKTKDLLADKKRLPASAEDFLKPLAEKEATLDKPRQEALYAALQHKIDIDTKAKTWQSRLRKLHSGTQLEMHRKPFEAAFEHFKKLFEPAMAQQAKEFESMKQEKKRQWDAEQAKLKASAPNTATPTATATTAAHAGSNNALPSAAATTAVGSALLGTSTASSGGTAPPHTTTAAIAVGTSTPSLLSPTASNDASRHGSTSTTPAPSSAPALPTTTTATVTQTNMASQPPKPSTGPASSTVTTSTLPAADDKSAIGASQDKPKPVKPRFSQPKASFKWTDELCQAFQKAYQLYLPLAKLRAERNKTEKRQDSAALETEDDVVKNWLEKKVMKLFPAKKWCTIPTLHRIGKTGSAEPRKRDKSKPKATKSDKAGSGKSEPKTKKPKKSESAPSSQPTSVSNTPQATPTTDSRPAIPATAKRSNPAAPTTTMPTSTVASMGTATRQPGATAQQVMLAKSHSISHQVLPLARAASQSQPLLGQPIAQHLPMTGTTQSLASVGQPLHSLGHYTSQAAMLHPAQQQAMYAVQQGQQYIPIQQGYSVVRSVPLTQAVAASQAQQLQQKQQQQQQQQQQRQQQQHSI
eukprot:TRINITY_DN11865_c1_g6_i1.p1 TRINITY_DN11865_c1_g6~~TRINITY_DN11865_c1_g6_i1.p1  ORF type:complete len:850 (+),score=226.21 TRINITY_DN11865_c1_g6_i1:436-2985(+)